MFCLETVTLPLLFCFEQFFWMIGKNTIKLIHSLSVKKYRVIEKSFLVEGDKNVLEVVQSGYKVKQLFATKKFLSEQDGKFGNIPLVGEVTSEEIKKASLLKNPQNCLAICEIPEIKNLPSGLPDNLSLYLDGIQDPGNLGTIIRICDWFGITHLFCSPDTADFFNPKVIQASMGSFCRINVWYTPFDLVLNLANQTETTILGAFLDGHNIFTETFPVKSLMVLGNEGNGIRKEIEQNIGKRIKIPSFAVNSSGAESLNVAVATGIICAEFRRQNLSSYHSK